MDVKTTIKTLYTELSDNTPQTISVATVARVRFEIDNATANPEMNALQGRALTALAGEVQSASANIANTRGTYSRLYTEIDGTQVSIEANEDETGQTFQITFTV